MLKIVVTGASGLLGRSIAREFSDVDDWSVIGTAWTRARDPVHRLDLLDREAVERFLREERPSVVLHAAAERRPDVSERDPERTRALNVDATRTLVGVAREVGAWVLYLSTDYVFDGLSPPQRTEDAPHPLNLYGETKLAGERIVLEDARNVVLRVPLLYGPVETLDESPVTVIAKSVLAHRANPSRPLVLDHWATRYPTFTEDVAHACRRLLELRQESDHPRGVLHFSGDEPLTKYDMACVISEIAGCSTRGLVPSAERPPGAPRPEHVRLDVSALEALGVGRRTPFREALSGVLRPHV